MSENKLLDQSFEFAATIVNLADSIKVPKSSYMIDQLARAGTSVGANIHEAQYAHSKADFIAKLEIALKEANETSYWLKLMLETNRIDEAQYKATEKLCGNIRRLLIASCQTAKSNSNRSNSKQHSTNRAESLLRPAFFSPKNLTVSTGVWHDQRNTSHHCRAARGSGYAATSLCRRHNIACARQGTP